MTTGGTSILAHPAAGSGRTGPLKVTWLPAHPSQGSVSMDRYWSALDAARRSLPAEIEVRCPLGEPAMRPPRATRWTRAWHRYRAYPRLVRRVVDTPLVHLLDHSSAHLIPRLRPGVKIVVTVHDLIPLGEHSDLTLRQKSRFRRCVRSLQNADLLVAVSEHTKTQIRRHLGISPDRIVVAPNGVDAAFFRRKSALPPALEPVLARPLLLSVGSTQARKNLAVLPAVVDGVRRHVPDVGVVRVGVPLDTDLRRRLAAALSPGGLVELGFVRDAQLPAVYQAASAMVFPSTDEGFGLPLLEAMAAGCPVVSSNAASLPEAGGNAALYFDPNDPSEAARAVLRVLRDDALRADLVRRGAERAERFTWERHFRGVLDAYARAERAKEDAA